MNTPKPANMPEADQMFVLLLAHIEMIEATLMLLWNDHPDRERVRASAKLIADAREAIGLHESTSELSLAIRSQARQASFDSIFGEMLPASEAALLRKP